MKASFEQYLHAQSRLNEAEIALISSLGKERQLKRNETILAEGEISRYKVFVVSGLLKAYTLCADGNETIFSFLQEQAWTSLDVESYHTQSPSSFHIAAIEPSALLIWSRREFDSLLSELPVLKDFADLVGAQKIYTNKQRLMTALTVLPDEKYQKFQRDYPELLGRIPLHMIAAYLGVSVKTLTRVRHKQLHR